MIDDSKPTLKILPLCLITHHDITTFEVDEMVQNMGNWISQKWSMTLPKNKQLLKLYLKEHIFRSNHFFVEVTFLSILTDMKLTENAVL